MKRLRSLIALICCFLLLTGFTVPFNDDLKIFEETGQVTFFELNKSVDFSKLLDESDSDDLFNSYDLLKEIERHQNEGYTIQAIGYTRIYLKEDTINGQKIVLPLTHKEMNDYKKNKDDISPYATGDTSTSPGGNFTLYTIASFRGTDIYATAIGDYKGYFGRFPSETPQNNKYDYISISMPTQYTLYYSVIQNQNYSTYKAAETNNAVSHGILLKASPSSPGLTHAQLSAKGSQNTYINSKKIISHYVHNYNTTHLSISFSTSGLSLSVSPASNFWQIASSVVLY